MKKLSEESVLEYFQRNPDVILAHETKSIFLSQNLINKGSIIKRLCYLCNIHAWDYYWMNSIQMDNLKKLS